MHAVKVFMAVIRIQKVLRGSWCRKRLKTNKENGVWAIENAVIKAIGASSEAVKKKIATGLNARSSQIQALQSILAQITEVSAGLSKLEGDGRRPQILPALPKSPSPTAPQSHPLLSPVKNK